MVKKIMMGLHLFIGVGAMMGGLVAVLDPQAPMGISPATLHGAFVSFMIPGLFLFIAIGLGNLLGFYLMRKANFLDNYYSFFMGLVLVLWIIVQCMILRDIVLLHVIFATLGLIQMLGSVVIIKEKNNFPF